MLSAAPRCPLLFNQAVRSLITPVAAQQSHLRLHLDAAADNVDLRCPLCLLGIRIVPHHLAAAVTQLPQTGANLSISACLRRHPVRSQAADDRACIITAPYRWQCLRNRLEANTTQNVGADAHQPLPKRINRLFGSPRPDAMIFALFSRATCAFNLDSSAIKSAKS